MGSHNVGLGNLFSPIFLNTINGLNEIRPTLQYFLSSRCLPAALRDCQAVFPEVFPVYFMSFREAG